jgi:dihydrofolate reductase
MGRKTWDSLPRKPLPNRKNIVLTRNLGFSPIGAEVEQFETLDLEQLQKSNEEFFIIGGSEIYKLFMPYTRELLVTTVLKTYQTDTYAPQIDKKNFTIVEEKVYNGWKITYYQRICS